MNYQNLQKQNAVLVDNWSLESVTKLLSPEKIINPKDLFYKSTALIHLIDILIIHDTIYFDLRYASNWKLANKLDGLGQQFQGFELSSTESEWMNQNLLIYDPVLGTYNPVKKSEQKGIVEDGIDFYSNLSKIWGIHYWPYALRMDQMAVSNDQSTGIHSNLVFKIKNNLENYISESLKDLNIKLSKIFFPGFGISVLEKASNKDDILKIAKQFRRNSACKKFRNWLKKINSYLYKGNIHKLSQSIKSVNDIIYNLNNELTGKKSNEKKSETALDFSLGVTPGVSIKLNSLSNVFKLIKPKPFLAQFLQKYLKNIQNTHKLNFQIKRLFG